MQAQAKRQNSSPSCDRGTRAAMWVPTSSTFQAPQTVESAPRAEPETGFAPPFRAMLSEPIGALGSIAATGQVVFEQDKGPLPDVPGYETMTKLGRGGMGIVYLARQHSLKRCVAVKMILSGLDGDAIARTRFRTEAEAIARLQHPNIVQIYEIGEHDGLPFLALEYLAGGSLAEKVCVGPLPDRDAAGLMELLARAVHYMHERGILHRDLKPSNVLLAADGTPKITDFGLAKLLDSNGGATRSEMVLGTPNYMAPEQTTGDAKSTSTQADIYSLGAILYELLTGKPPFHGATPLSILEQVRNEEPTSPRRLRPATPVELETICLKCLEKEPVKRYPSAVALADDFRRYLDDEPIQARPVPIWRRIGQSARPMAVARVIAALALLTALLVGGWYFRAAGQLARHRAEDRYGQFVKCRDDAFFYGLIAQQEPSFLGVAPSAGCRSAERAARDALKLAGVQLDSDAPAVDAQFAPQRTSEITGDSYALLLLMARLTGLGRESGVRSQESAISEEQERYRKALRLLDVARGLGLQTRAYHRQRADLLTRLGECDEADRESDRAGSVPLDGVLDHFLAGQEAYRRGHWESCRKHFNEVLALQPGHYLGQFFLAVCHLKEHRWEAAKAGLDAAIAQRTEFIWPYLFRSFANERLGAPPRARADFDKALALHPNEDARYVLFQTRGILRFNQREFALAATDFRRALALRPEQHNAYVNLAHVHLARGQLEQAEEQINIALRHRPPAAAVAGYHLERGRYLLRDKKYESALEACAAASKWLPDLPQPHELSGYALLALGRYGEAERAFDRRLQNGGVDDDNIFRSRGAARMTLGKYPEAVEDYSLALVLAADAEVYQHRGWAHFFSDAWKLALRDFAKAIELDAQCSDAYTGQGLAHVMLGDYRSAVNDAEAALGLKPSTPEMMHNIACIYAQAMKYADADRQGHNLSNLAMKYGDRALEALRKTLVMLPAADRLAFWQNKILTDAALAPIRAHPEFQSVHDEYVERP